MVYLTTPSLAVGDAEGSDDVNWCIIPKFMCGNSVGIAVLLTEFWTWQIWNTKHYFYPVDRVFLLALVRLFAHSSSYFGRHTDHHQEPKTALVASGFAYVEDCWTFSCWTL